MKRRLTIGATMLQQARMTDLQDIEELDRAWFDQHPRRCLRVRYAFAGEHRPPDEVWRGMWDVVCTVVYRSRRSGRMRKWPLYMSLF